jgi:hypothetical protein
MSLMLTRGGPHMILSDREGTRRADLRLREGIPSLEFATAEGKPRTSLSATGGAAGLDIYGETGVPQVRVLMLENKPHIGFYNARGKADWEVP